MEVFPEELTAKLRPLTERKLSLGKDWEAESGGSYFIILVAT